MDDFVTRILLLSANPSGTSRLRLDEEMREIKEGLKRSKERDRYFLYRAEAIRYRDIHRAILEFEPHIIHFSGHGAGEEGLVFEDEVGQIKLIDANALAGLFSLFADQVQCVVLNACYSQYQAAEIARHINYVVGMSRAIQDRAAVEFAVGFYDALGAGKDYNFAYKLGCSLIQVAGIPQNLIPQLITKNNLQNNPQNNLQNNLQKNLPGKSAAVNGIKCVYLERPEVETKCYETIVGPGGLLRIKGPQKMGKSLLLENVLCHGRRENYQTAKLDLNLADSSILKSYKDFLQWLCVDVSESLELEAKIDDYWKEMYGLNKGCTRYFQKYLLPSIDSPLVFAIDNFERLLEYPTIFSEFCGLLRNWYETTKQGDRVGNIWKKMRLVVVHSTEKYPDLDINHSPFNVGVPVELSEFTLQQVETIAKGYELNGKVGEDGVNQIYQLLGGHPFLIQEAFSYLKGEEDVAVDELLNIAATEQGPFSDHLRQQLWSLQHNPMLEDGYRKVVMANEPVQLATEVGFKLHSLGLVKLSGNNCVSSRDLYTRYFSVRLSNASK
jgi:AAA-like domain/CHAT domain